ncbi:MAG: hypothetical protein V3W06_02595 [Acidimicrobiia bacterium]
MGGWVRWPPGGPVLETKRQLGAFTLLLTKRDPTAWQVDLARGSKTTVVVGRDVVEAEQHALLWAMPIMQSAWKQTEAAFRAQNRTP